MRISMFDVKILVTCAWHRAVALAVEAEAALAAVPEHRPRHAPCPAPGTHPGTAAVEDHAAAVTA